MDTEAYIIYGMVFGFLSLWLLFSLAKKLGGSKKFPKQNEDRENENKKQKDGQPETCSDTQSAPTDWNIEDKGLVLEREKTNAPNG